MSEGQVNTTRVTDVKTLGMTGQALSALQEIVDKNKMMWELWIGSANSFQEFLANLQKRGYSNLPMSEGIAIYHDNLVGSVMNLNGMKESKIMMKRASG